MLRGVVYLVSGWVALAFVGGMADVLALTIMLPATSAIVLAHAAFAPISVPAGLAVATALGYLEDLHQGAPIGTLCLAHSVAFLGLRWAAQRFHVGGWMMQAFAGMAGVLLVDLATAGVLTAMSDSLGVFRPAIHRALPQLRWHALATGLAAPVVWVGLDLLMQRLRLEEPPPTPMTTFSQALRKKRS